MDKMAEEKTKKEDSGSVAKSEAKPDRPANLCCYSQRVCNLEKLKGFDFCHKHILEDKASPFKPCDFVAKSNARRCPNPAPKLPDRGKSFCIIHTRKAELRRAVEERRKKKHPREDDVYGYDANKEKRRRTSSSNSQKSDKGEGKSSDEETTAGSCDDYPKVDSAWHGDIDSDADSVDSEEEDPLKHAGVWTVEEATRMCRDKMMRLRSLYIAQFKRLQHVLKERKRKYCLAIQAEEEEEAGECQLTPSQLLGRKRRHERPGSEALLHKQAKEKKQGTPTRQQTVSTLRCTYSPGGNRCTEKVMPLTKHCMKHITHDPKQQLFQRCSFAGSNGDSRCERIVSKVFTHNVCKLHTELPASMKRPDIKRDLQDAKERARLRSSRVLENEDEGGVPDALQQKSSALVPPSTSCVKETEPAETLPSASESTSLTSVTRVTPTACPEKMEIGGSGDSKVGDESTLLTASNSATASSSSSSLATLSSISPALENISPGLAAASLVAVCSSPQIALQGTLLDSVSNAKERADVKSLTSHGNEQKRLNEDASCEGARDDVDSKPADAKKADSLEDVKDAGVAKHYATTVSQAKDSKESGGSAFGSDNATFRETQAKGSEHVKAESSVLKEQEEGQVLEFSSKSSSQSSSQLLSEDVATPETTSASGKDASSLESDTTRDSGKVLVKSVSQSALKNSCVTSPMSANTVRESSSETPATASSKGAASVSNVSTISPPAPTKASPLELSVNTPEISSKSAAQVASKSETSSSQGTGKTSLTAPFASAKAAPRENSDNAPKVAPKRVSQAALKGHTDASLGTPNASNTPQSASTKAGDISENTPNTSSRGASQVLPRGDTQKASSQGVVKQGVQVTSGSSLRTFQVPTTATTAPVTQPSKTKPLVTSDIQRPSGVKAFQHLPSGMTSSSSKQFSAITSIASKDTGKDLKADHT